VAKYSPVAAMTVAAAPPALASTATAISCCCCALRLFFALLLDAAHGDQVNTMCPIIYLSTFCRQ